MLAFFAVLTLLLAIGGIYAVLSYVVGRRRAELGVRLALGAEPRQVVRMVVGQGLRLVAIGAAIGFPVAIDRGGIRPRAKGGPGRSAGGALGELTTERGPIGRAPEIREAPASSPGSPAR